jgi:hypothetical protein
LRFAFAAARRFAPAARAGAVLALRFRPDFFGAEI